MDARNGECRPAQLNEIRVSGIQVEWHLERGTCTFEKLPVAMMWVETTLAGLLSGVQAMVGTERFLLALQSEGRKSVETDWKVIATFSDFQDGFRAIARIAAVAGWGCWELICLDQDQRTARFRVEDSWEGRYQKALGVNWGSGVLAGKMAGYCSKLFETNCWADQTMFIAEGDACDEFVVKPSSRLVETEIENLLASDEVTRADMAVALRKLEQEIAERRRMEEALHSNEKQARQIAQENAAIAEVGRIISSACNIDEIYERFAEEVRKLIPFDRIVIDLIPPEKNSFTIAYTAGVEIPGRGDGDTFPLIGSDDEYLLRSRSGLFLQAEEEEIVATHYPILLPTYRAGFRSMMSVPLVSKDEVIGGLHFRTFSPKTYGEAELRLAERVGTQIAGTIANGQLLIERKRTEEALRASEEEANHLARENAVIAEIGRIIGSTLSIAEVYKLFSEKVGELIPFDRIGVGVINLERNTVEFPYIEGICVSGRQPGDIAPLAGTAAERVMQTRKSHLFQAESEEEIAAEVPGLLPEFQSGIRSALTVPLVSRDQVIGALSFRSTIPEAYADRDVMLAESIGSQIAGAIANAQLFIERKRTEEALRRSEEQARELAKENAIMAEIGRIISSTLNIDEVYERFAEEARTLIPFDRIVISMLDLQKMTGVSTYISGKKVTDRWTDVPYPLAGTGIAEMIRTRASVLIQPEEFREVKDRFPGLDSTFQAGFRSIMNVPLYVKGQIMGGLLFRSVHPNAYTVKDVRLAERIGAQIAGAIANAQLFTERQRLEERLRRAEKMEAIGTLAGGVAHDLNNVLGVLVGYSELLLMEIQEGSRLRKHVSNILQSGQRAAAIIQDLLTLARRGVAVSEVVNLNSVISDYLKTPEFEKLKAYHPRLTFRAELDQDLMNIKGSPIHLTKTIMNLLSNAAEAIVDCGDVTTLTENRYLDKPITGYDQIQEGDYVVLKVSDNGKGISTADMGKIFEPFYTKKAMGRSGTGLGLAVVWGAVKDHGGYIDVQSEEGKGSTFTLYFPVTREERAGGHKGVSPESYAGRGESILVVDDVKEQRELAMAMLTNLGYRVNAVQSGEEALEYFKANRTDVMVLDMIMDPGMDGLETYQRVLEINPKQKAIIVSGFSETDRVKKAQELGAGAYVKKPYIREKIGVAIRRELDK
jgi:signal transduction histidine kinase